MPSALNDQHWNTSHPNAPTRKMTNQSGLADKEVYLREDALCLQRKNDTKLLTVQKKK
jgi:hypothetical protein